MFHASWLAVAVVTILISVSSVAQSNTTDALIRMTDQLDQLDRMDFQAHLDKAAQCARSRDLFCAEAQLGKAAKLVNGTKDKSALASSRENLLAVRKQITDEAAVLAERKAELERRETRLQEQQDEEERQARRRARESDDDSSSTASTIALFGKIMLDGYAKQLDLRSAARAEGQRRLSDMQSFVENDTARNQQRFAQERAQIQAQREALQRPSQTGRDAMQPRLQTEQRAAMNGSRPAENSRNAYNLPAGSPSNDQLARLGAQAAGIDLTSLDRKPAAQANDALRNPSDSSRPPASGPAAKEEKRLYTYTKESLILNSPASLFNDEQNSQDDVEKQFKKYSGRNFGGYELAIDSNVNKEIISRGTTLCEKYRYAGKDAFQCKIPVVIKYTSYKDPNEKDAPSRGVSR